MTDSPLARYAIRNIDSIPSPSLLFFQDGIEHNLQSMIEIAGDPQRLCPHCKTHKTRELIRRELELGITHHKAATLVEAEMLAQTNVPDVLIAYPLVGPNLHRLRQLIDTYTQIRFSVLVDSFAGAELLAQAIDGVSRPLNVLVDLDSGMGRTGIQPGPAAIELMEMVASTSPLQLEGLHWYDGHHRQPDPVERRQAVRAGWERFVRFRDQAALSGLPIRRIVAGGSGSFPILAEVPEPFLQLSPGTTVLYDADLSERFPELPFIPAIGILTRVISHPGPGRVTLDAGHKACCADQPAGRRLWFPRFPQAVEIGHTEEHLVIESDGVSDLKRGEALVAIPRHACSTVAAHPIATLIRNGEPVGQWTIAARDRVWARCKN